VRRLSFAFAVAAVVAVAVPAFAAGSPARGPQLDPNHKITQSTSTNWSGYAATGARFTSISSSWTEPLATCSAGETSYSSFWVGLDGDTSGTVEQTGTDADCSSGVPRYYAWYEMYPKFPTNLSFTVNPNDTLSASVSTDGVGRFTLSISDSTQGWNYSTTQRLKSAALASAEVIAEAPSSRSGVLPLTNFGKVNFGASSANGASLASAPNLDPITMVSSSGAAKAQPSNPIGKDGSFSVTWISH
jgi:peptidase A4-like protein